LARRRDASRDRASPIHASSCRSICWRAGVDAARVRSRAAVATDHRRRQPGGRTAPRSVHGGEIDQHRRESLGVQTGGRRLTRDRQMDHRGVQRRCALHDEP
jgi:hypothetical protein